MPLILGLIALVCGVLLIKWYSDADAKKITSSVRWTGLLLGLLIVLGLAVTGRLGTAAGAVVAMGAWVWRVFGWGLTLHQMTGGFKGFGRQAGGESQSTEVSVGMDEAEALRILGLSRGATSEDINAAYRRLMGQLHPDKGGSDYLAAKVNAARELLLKRPG
jgi:hypothetical protein